MRGKPEYYCAAIDGQACMRISGRFRRHRLPLPAMPPPDGNPENCFLCKPEEDAFFQGYWGSDSHLLAVVGNAYPVADQAVLVAPPGPDQHLATPADLDTEHLARMLPLSFDSAFLEQFGLTGLEVVSFMNLGVPAAQSRRHPHLQIVGFSPERCNRAAGDPAGVAEELASAATEGRSLPVGPAKGIAVIPRQPSMTAELWIPRPEGAAAADRTWAACVQSVTTACTRAISGAYNLVIRRDPRMVRIVPRGLSERAGLELASPHVVDSVVAASVEETHALWAAALSVVAGEPA